MKTKIAITVLSIMIASVAFGLACGSASAPPVDLPAPITGRIDVSAPDADGNVTITGTDGAVDGGSTVMAVNEAVAGTQAFRIMKFFISDAWAGDSFPSVCSEAGHACALADANGAFVILLSASVGDSIAIGVIDSTSGEFISELSRVTISAAGGGGDSETGSETGSETEAVCSGVAGAVAGIAVIPGDGTPVLLKQGSETATNQLVIGDPVSGTTTLDIDGCYAHSIGVISSRGNITLAVSSKEDKTIWTGTYDASSKTVSNERTMTLDVEPMDIIFLGDSSYVLAALKSSDSVYLRKISLADGSVLTDAASPSSAAGITRSTKLDAIAMSGSAQYLVLMLTENESSGESYLTLFATTSTSSDAVSHKMTFSSSSFYPGVTLNNIDAAFYLDSGSHINIAGISPSNKILAKLVLYTDSSYTYKIYSTQDLNSISGDLYTSYTHTDLSAEPTGIVISDYVSAGDSSPPTAVVSLSDGTVYMESLVSAGTGTVSVAAGDNLTAIALDDSSQSVYALDATEGESAAVSGLSWDSPPAVVGSESSSR